MGHSSPEYNKEWAKNNKEKLDAAQLRYRRKKGLKPRPSYFSKKEVGTVEYQKLYYGAIGKERKVSKYNQYKNLFFDMYGRRCACCGESEMEFLSVEHIKGLQGQRRKRGLELYRETTKEYRPDLYEVLCMNCNHAKMRLGYCPHNREHQLIS